MALSKPTLNTPSYTRQRLRIEFINAHCIERKETITELRRCIGTKHKSVERKGYLDIYVKEDVNKNMLPRTVDLSKVKVRNNNMYDIQTALLDLRNGKFIKKTVICLKNVRSTKSNEAVNSQGQLLRTQGQDTEQWKQARLSSYARYLDHSNLQARLHTFKHRNGPINWPHDISIQDTTLLAKHGFFFTGRVDLCCCYLCGLGLKDWSRNDDVLFAHLKYSPNCKHLTEIVDSNILSVYRKNIQRTTEGNSHALTGPGAANTIKHPAYQGYSVRLTTFKTWPRELLQTSGMLAEAGFFYTEGNSHALTGPGAANTIKHPAYQGYSVRLTTFKTWPRELLQTSGMLAEAGFFYTGRRDIVRCFACDGGLQQWDANDQPWIEHARWFPFCEHVRREKGDEYIRRVQTAAETQDDEEITEKEIPSDSPFPKLFTAATHVMGLGYPQSAVRVAIDECKTNNLSLTADNITNVLLYKEEKGEVLPTDSQRSESPTAPQFNKCKSHELTKHWAANTIKHPEYQDDTVSLSSLKNWLFDHVQTPGMFGEADIFSTGITNKELLEENTYLKSMLMCTVCQHIERSILFLPCCHRLMCIGCSDKDTECPACSKTIVNKQKIDIS